MAVEDSDGSDIRDRRLRYRVAASSFTIMVA